MVGVRWPRVEGFRGWRGGLLEVYCSRRWGISLKHELFVFCGLGSCSCFTTIIWRGYRNIFKVVDIGGSWPSLQGENSTREWIRNSLFVWYYVEFEFDVCVLKIINILYCWLKNCV